MKKNIFFLILLILLIKEVKLHGITAVVSLDTGFRRGAKPRTESHSSTPLQAWLSGAWVNTQNFIFAEEQARNGPQIKIESHYWNFGEVQEGQIKEKLFVIENIGNENLLIDKIYTSCGCTTAEISSRRIAPQTKADLRVIYNALGKQEGLDSKDVYIVSNDPLHPTEKINISAKIVEHKDASLETKATKIPTITSEELYTKIEKKEKVIILDVREENEYIERHIPGAIWFPKSKFDKDSAFTENILKKIDKNSVVVSYCGAGHRSSYVTRKLRERGFKVFNLEGVSFWEKKGYPLIRGPKLPASQEPAIVHLEEAYEHYFKLFKDVVWVDLRNREDYRKGHIKGALGIPLSELEDNLQDIPQGKEIVLYCEGTWEGGKCDASMSAGRILIKKGYKQGNIKVFEDGFGAWENAGYPIEKEREWSPAD